MHSLNTIDIKDNIKNVLERIEGSKSKYNRTSDKILLLAVSKNKAIESVQEAYKAGLDLFGENRVQEAQGKFTNYTNRDLIQLHYLGSLQKNKIKRALKIFDCIQSIDSIELCKELISMYRHLHSAEQDQGQNTIQGTKPYPIFIQITCSDFDAKHGFNEYNKLCEVLDLVVAAKEIRLHGIMTIGPNSKDEIIVRSAFCKAREWKEKIEKEFKLRNLVLSMGMSEDYDWAIAEGTTMLRIGSSIFGSR